MLEWTEDDGTVWRATKIEDHLTVDCAAGQSAGWHTPPMPAAGSALYRQLVKVTSQLEAVTGSAVWDDSSLRGIAGRLARLEADASDDDQFRGDLDGQSDGIETNRKRIEALDTLVRNLQMTTYTTLAGEADRKFAEELDKRLSNLEMAHLRR